ncbi:MAG: methyltransferase domain-containing protein [Oligoflexia bacterium]|nr:methyltransferase domain-containing protein [Oligoflexia bacterium]
MKLKNIIKNKINDAIYSCKLNTIFYKRDRLSNRYLNGTGIEIGALHRPLWTSKYAKVLYLDRMDKDAAIKIFPDLQSEIIIPDIIADGFTLAEITNNQYQFCIANHVLEHSPNPLQVLKNWIRVLAPNGILFFSVPLAQKCFDRGRAITSLEHLIYDYQIYSQNDLYEIAKKNREHYHEWLMISDPNIYKSRGAKPLNYSPQKINELLDKMTLKNAEIHFHTFTFSSLKRLIKYFVNQFNEAEKNININIMECTIRKGEIICILKKINTYP